MKKPTAFQKIYYFWLKWRNDIHRALKWDRNRFHQEIFKQEERRRRLGIPWKSDMTEGKMAEDLVMIIIRLAKGSLK